MAFLYYTSNHSLVPIVYPSGTDMHLEQLKFRFIVIGFKFAYFKKVEPIRAVLFFSQF